MRTKDKLTSKILSPECLIPGGTHYNRFLPDIPEQIFLCKEGYRYIFQNTLHLKTIDSDEEIWKFTISDFNNLLKQEKLKPLKTFPELHFLKSESHIYWTRIQNRLLFINCSSKETVHILNIHKECNNIDFNEEKKIFSYTQRNGIHLLYWDNRIMTIYQDKKQSITAGQIPSRNEFGLEKGIFWSPTGNFIAFYKIDESQISSYPLVHINKPIAKLQKIKYPMSGQKSQKLQIGIFDIKNESCTFLPVSNKKEESYLTCLTWSPDEKYIYLAELNRQQKECKLKRYSLKEKTEKILFIERDKKYTEPQHPLFFPDNNPDYFVWQSRKDGFNHLYLYDCNGNFIRQLTHGNWEVTQIAGFREKSIIFLSTYSSPLNRNICSVNIDNGNMCNLTEEAGTHRIFMNQENSFFIDHFDSKEDAGKLFLRSFPNGDIIRIIKKASDPYKEYSIPKTEIGSFFNEKGTELYYRIVYPQNLNRDKKYPLVFYVYGGPHVQLIRNEWLAGTKGFEYLMAQAGYIVFSIDPRGSNNRGKIFEDEIWRNIGKAQFEDYKYSIKWILSKKKYIDSKRIGVYGWSFGGFMATTLMLKSAELFKVGVAGGAVIDWSLYEVMYTERYMDTPNENPNGYKENNLCNFVNQLKGELLLIHCDTDPVVLWQHTLSFLKYAIKEKKQIDYFVYPGYGHNVQGEDRVHLMLKIKKYFDEKL